MIYGLQTIGVSPFGHLRITGCYTPPRSLSQLRHVLHRLVVPRHPPYALGFYWEPKKPSTHNMICYEFVSFAESADEKT